MSYFDPLCVVRLFHEKNFQYVCQDYINGSMYVKNSVSNFHTDVKMGNTRLKKSSLLYKMGRIFYGISNIKNYGDSCQKCGKERSILIKMSFEKIFRKDSFSVRKLYNKC